METRRNTTAGVMFWTPAPARTSPSSTITSEDVGEDEDEEQAERDDDFVSQMDENGIIGLSEALEDVELGQTCVDAECDPDWYSGCLTPEEADPSGCERDTPLDELSYNLSEHLYRSESAGEDARILLASYDMISSLKAWADDEEAWQREEEQGADHLSEGDKHLDTTEEGKRCDRNRKKSEHTSTSGELGDTDARVSNHHCQVSQSASVVAPLPHLLHFTAEELAAAPGIDAETFPETFTESLPESHCSHVSPKSSPRCPDMTLRASPQPTATFSEHVVSNNYSRVPGKGSGKSDKRHRLPVPCPRKTRKPAPEATCSSTARADSLKSKHQNTSHDRESRTPRARSNADVGDESRKTPLTYHTPDFSHVEPRVCFPKSGYNPPKSRRSFTRDSLSPEQPLVFKSPADIVKEVLLNTTDGSPASSDSNGTPTRATNSTIPHEFRCRQQATTLLEQLQEDYNRLLTKYADAENTIDRLRLEAKVNLYSDPPKAGHCVQSGLNHDPSKFIKLDFPQAQKAEINSDSVCPNGHSAHQGSSAASPSTRSPDVQLGQQLANILFNQTDKFIQQLQTFEDLCKSNKLKPSEQVKGLSHLAEGLESLQRGYLLARNEHKLLQQRGAELSPFDPERELEGLIFQCGLRMEDLEEQVEQMQQEQPICEALPSPPTPLSESLAHPQSPPVPLLVDPGEAADVEVSSASNESDEETLYLKPQPGQHRCAEQDFMAVDHYQSFKELPRLLDHSLQERAPLSAALTTDMQTGDEETESQGTGNNKVRKTLPQRTAKSDHQDSPVGTCWSSRSSLPSCSQSTTTPAPPPSSRRRLEVRKSHSSSLSSLGDIAASERMSSKVQAGSRRVLLQDGIISPETDSGFVGSESSRLTPAAAPSPLHQRALENVSGPQEGNSGRPQTGPVSAASPPSSPPHSHTAKELRGDSRLSSDQLRGTRQGQSSRTFSCSPQHWVHQRRQTRVDSGTSGFGLESDSTPSGSEGEQSDRYTRAIDSLHSSHSSSSPAAPYLHGDPLRAQSSSQVANCKDAIQTLQAEVTRLAGTLESCLSNKNPLSFVRAATSAQENCSYHNTSTPRRRPEEQQSDVRGGRRETPAVEKDSMLRRTARRRSASAQRPKPQHDILTRSELQSSAAQPQMSRSTQTTAAPDSRCSHTTTVHSRRTQSTDEPDSRHRGRSERPAGGNRKPTHASSTSCGCCPLCGRLELYKHTEPDCRRHSDCPTHISCQPAESPDRAARSRYLAATAPPALLQCMPVCPPQLLVYSSPLYVSPNNSTGTSPGVRGRGEVRSTRRSPSADKHRSLDSSLNRAIRAAQHMKHSSRHMARTLATGLQYQERLTQSCSY